MSNLDTSIILIGPMAAGKTTIGKLLGEKLELPVIELDDLRWGYAAEIGYDANYAEQLRRDGGIDARSVYWKPFEVHAVERVLQDYPTGHVLSFGAGHSVYDEPAQFERVAQALAPYPYVILLLPSADNQASMQITFERFKILVPDCPDEVLNQVEAINRYFIEHPSNQRLATHTIYTADKSVDETCADILAVLDLDKP